MIILPKSLPSKLELWFISDSSDEGGIDDEEFDREYEASELASNLEFENPFQATYQAYSNEEEYPNNDTVDIPNNDTTYQAYSNEEEYPNNDTIDFPNNETDFAPVGLGGEFTEYDQDNYQEENSEEEENQIHYGYDDEDDDSDDGGQNFHQRIPVGIPQRPVDNDSDEVICLDSD